MKKMIVTGIQEASDSFEEWLGQAQLLVEGKSTHFAREPVSCEECTFGLWLYSEANALQSYPWFEEVETLHQAFRDAYEAIYEGANEVYDAESLLALKNHFIQLEDKSDLLATKLEEIKESLENTEEDIFENNSATINEKTDEEISAEETVDKEPSQEKQSDPQALSYDDVLSPVVISAQVGTQQLEMHKKLKALDLKQLEQEQKLTEQELQQLEDRQALTSQSVAQIAQYQQLKNDEIKQQLEEHQKLEDDNADAKTLGLKELNSVNHSILQKRDELGQLELVDKKLENRKVEEQKKEQAILDNFERKQFADKQDIIDLEQQCKKWKNEAEKLQQQLQLVEQDIEDLVGQQQEKQSILEGSNREKELKLEELEAYSKQQEILNGHKFKVKETKQEELAQLEEKKTEFEQKVARLDADALALKNQKLEMNKQQMCDLKQLDEQERFKKVSMDKLEQDTMGKIKEFKALVHQQEVIKKSLSEMEQQSDTEKALEEA